MKIVVGIKNTLEVECAQIYTDTMGVLTQLSEARVQQEIIQNDIDCARKGAEI